MVGDILFGLGVDETQEGQLNGLNVVGDLETQRKYQQSTYFSLLTQTVQTPNPIDLGIAFLLFLSFITM